tara:strand:+ start:107 stop:1639 length:1533 start_codon:yes stop_codon:yes gene_type:complete
MVDITFNYTLEVDGYAYIRFKNGPDTEHNITYVSKLLSAGSGTETLSLEIPSRFEGEELPLGTGYNYQAQLFDHNNGWAGLDTKDYNGLTLLAALPKANDLNLINYPTTVTAGSYVDLTFDYVTDKAEAYAIVRFKNAGNLTQVLQLVTVGSGTKTVSLEIPNETLGEGYSFQVQLFDHTAPGGWNSAIVSKDYSGITLEEALAPTNAITLNDMPTSVAAGSDVNITFDYLTDIENAHIFIRFKDNPNAEGLTSVSKVVAAGSGTLTLPLPIPVDKDGTALPLGAGYSFQVQLFDIDDNYKNYISDSYTGVTLEAVPANTVSIANPPSTVLINSTVDIIVDYTKDITDAFVVLKFRDALGNDIDPSVLVPITDNSGQVTLTLNTPTTEGTEYWYKVQILDQDANALYTKNYSGITAATTLSADSFNRNFDNLSIFPNPVTDSFTYKFDSALNNSTRVELFTVLGKKVISIENNDTFGNSGTVDTKNLSKGIYLVRITSGDLQETRKLVKN